MGKLNKNEMIAQIAKDECLPVAKVREICDAFLGRIQDAMCEGQDVSLTGFGSFSIKKHKGHPVQFESQDPTVKDYAVIKFNASSVMMNKIRDAYSEGKFEIEE